MMTGSDATILVVDDEMNVRVVVGKMLELCGYAVHLAQDGEEAVAFFREHPDEIDLVILDMSMPRLNGVETLRELRAIRHDIRVILASGHSKQDVFTQIAGDSGVGFLPKPFHISPLVNMVEKMLGC